MRPVRIRLTLAACLIACGCGLAPSELLFQVADSSGRVALDLWLTEVANNLADATEIEPDPPMDDEPDPDDDPMDEPDPVDDGVAAGAAIYLAEGCASCHCDDGGGGCALSAPPVAGASADLLTDLLVGDGTHPTKSSLSDEELANLAAYLASL